MKLDRLLSWNLATRPDRRTLTAVVATVGVVLLLLAGIVMVVYNERFYHEAKTRQVEVQARILASTVAAALLFDDRKAAQEYVKALAGDTEVAAAGVYDAHGALFAGYSSMPGALPRRLDAPVEPTFDGDWLTLTAPVRQQGEMLGTVYMRSTVAPIFRRLAQYTAIGFLIAMGACIFVLLGIAQSRLADANARLKRQSTDLAQANAELRAQIEHRERAENALRQAQKMEAIGQLTGGIAHDFNNLLQVILGNLEALQRRLPDAGGEVKRTINAARRGAERAATLTQRLLAFSRRQPLNPKQVDVNKLVSGMSELLHRTLGEGISVETVLAQGIWRVAVDANQLENALINLAVNGRDAMPAGGKLSIETANAALDELHAGANELEPGDYVLIAVSDTGEGMDSEVAQKAFEPFFTTKDVGKGSGLGLSQVYGFVRQSGGHARIHSEVGRGTTVSLYLPRLASAEEPVEALRERRDAAMSAAGPPQGARPLVGGGGAQRSYGGEHATGLERVILVVEDEEDVRAHAAGMLRELGYQVLEAADADAALRALDEHAHVDLLFTDVGLPGGVNGRQLADAARARHQALRVLFTTGYERNAIAHGGKPDAEVELLPKPFTFADLADRVYRILARAPSMQSGGTTPAERVPGALDSPPDPAVS